jgi:putative cardiolipin synthase
LSQKRSLLRLNAMFDLFFQKQQARVKRVSLWRSFLAGVVVFLSLESVWGDSTLLLSNPKAAATVRMNLAHEAEREVLAVTYILEMDRAGLTLLAELREAARQGKRAVLVVDAFGNEVSASMLKYLASEGVEIYKYHPFKIKNPLNFFKRMHSKLFIVDGEHLVMGDRNGGIQYFGLSERSYVSRDAYARGKAAQDAKKHVEELIRSGEVERVQSSVPGKTNFQSEREMLDQVYVKQLNRRMRVSQDWKQELIDADSVEFFHDPIGMKGKSPGVERAIVEGIDWARERIIFENAYVSLSPLLKDALIRARDRGVEIVAVSTSPEATDVSFAAAGWEESRKFLASLGAQVLEHPGSIGNSDGDRGRRPSTRFKQRFQRWVNNELERLEKFRFLRSALKKRKDDISKLALIHAKVMTIDGIESYVMSYNFDPLSEKTNMETVLRIKDARFTQKLDGDIQYDIERFGYKTVGSGGVLHVPERSSSVNCVVRVLTRTIKAQF